MKVPRIRLGVVLFCHLMMATDASAECLESDVDGPLGLSSQGELASQSASRSRSNEQPPAQGDHQDNALPETPGGSERD